MTADDATAGSIGGKAHTLRLLADAGFLVPDGYVIDAATLARWVPGSPPPAEVAAEARRAVTELGEGPLAVRSSAIDEDDASASFAGVYTTTLDVVGADGVLAAIEACLVSRLGAPARAYRGAEPPPMAVLIQPMLAPSVAGIGFTADPVTGDRSVVRVSGVRGLGDAVASGEVTPDEWDVIDGTAHRRPDAGEEALTAEEVLAVADVARRIESHFGAPQDVEWAIVDGAVVVLQARPITSLPFPPAATLDGVNWEKDVAHYPEQVTPFGASVMPDPGRIASVFPRFGLLIDGLEDRVVGGELYVRPVPVIGSANSSAKPPPAWALGLAARVVPALRRRMKAADAAVDEGIDLWPRKWEDGLRDEFLARIAELLAVDLPALHDAGLAAHLGELRSLTDYGGEVHFLLTIPYFVALHRLDTRMQEGIGWTFDRTVALLASPASHAAADLAPVGDAVLADQRLRDVLAASPADPVGALRRVRPDLAATLEGWLHHHGWRTANYDAGSPALIERPGIVTRLLTTAPARADRREAEAAFAAAAADLGEAERTELVAALETARRIYPMREDNVILTDNIPCGLLRRWLLEAGRRLVERGLLSRLDDAPYLEAPEIVAGLAGSADDLRARVVTRRAEWAWVRAHPGPVFVGKRVPPPDVSRLPTAGRLFNGALLWAMSHEYPGAAEPGAGAGEVAGSPGSPGVYRGPVRVVRGEADFAKVMAGDVMVCKVTTPAWAVLFALAGALVTDGGGVLSHAAVVAREHGIPAVLGTVVATAMLRDGDLVEVDGSAGVVRRLA